MNPADAIQSPPSLETEFDEFLAAHPQFESCRHLDDLRRREFSRLDQQGQIYLDYTGGGLYSEGQVRRHSELLLGSVFGNPHSTNPTSRATTELVEDCRDQVLAFFNASRDEYAAIFTANASHALRLIGESYPFSAHDNFLLTYDNHNSVNGIREFDRARGATTTYIPLVPPEMRVDESALDRYLDLASEGGNNLFAYPAQSNFSGVQHPLEWIARAQAKGWDVLLDAAAFVPTNRLDLSRWSPDFAVLSFYKMFGYPTGVGLLLARREKLDKLHRPWFAGGTISVASVQADEHHLASGSAAFEDGTLDYANIPAVGIGLDFLDSVGMDSIHTRVQCLVSWLLERIQTLRHSNGRPLIHLYGPSGGEARGGTLALNFFDPQGEVIDHEIIEACANRRQISLRTGCFCNPGAGELALGLSKNEILTCFRAGSRDMTYDDFRRCIDGKSTGAVRISVGLVSNFADIVTFERFAREFIDRSACDIRP